MDNELFGSIVTNLILLAIILLVYTLPVVICRFAVYKRPLPNKKAIIISIIYGVIGAVIASVLFYFLNGTMLTGCGLLFWAYINYSILVQNDKKTRKDIPLDMMELYEQLSNDNKSLNNEEMTITILDFKERSKVFEGEYGKYKVSFPTKRKGLNGLLIVDNKQMKIYYFSAFMEGKPSIYIEYKDNMTMYYLDCELDKQ